VYNDEYSAWERWRSVKSALFIQKGEAAQKHIIIRKVAQSRSAYPVTNKKLPTAKYLIENKIKNS